MSGQCKKKQKHITCHLCRMGSAVIELGSKLLTSFYPTKSLKIPKQVCIICVMFYNG